MIVAYLSHGLVYYHKIRQPVLVATIILKNLYKGRVSMKGKTTGKSQDLDNYEQIILDSLTESNGSIILQDLINNTILPTRFLQTQKPRRY